MKHATVLDACCYLIRAGFKWDASYQRFARGSWNAYLIILKNGKCRTVTN